MQTDPSTAESDLPAKQSAESLVKNAAEPKLDAAIQGGNLTASDKSVSPRRKSFLEAVYHWVLSRS